METRDAYSSPQSSAKSAMETAAAMADLRVVARTSACRVAGGLDALEDAGPADALAGRGTEGPGRGTHQDPSAPMAWPSVGPGAPPSQRLKGCLVPDGKASASACCRASAQFCPALTQRSPLVRFVDSGGTRRPNCITRVGEIFRVGQRAARPVPERWPAVPKRDSML